MHITEYFDFLKWFKNHLLKPGNIIIGAIEIWLSVYYWILYILILASWLNYLYYIYYKSLNAHVVTYYYYFELLF